MLNVEEMLTYSFTEVDEDQGREDADPGPNCFLLFPFKARGSYSSPYDLHDHGSSPDSGLPIISFADVASNDGPYLYSIYLSLCNHHVRCS